MVERSFSLGAAGADIAALKEMLYAQQELLQKLYVELDVERESSSTAANEALSMILRLQGEKAALMMETNQYRRVADQKMCHAENSLALFEDLIYQKEMEIGSLEFQLQSYRCKLLSLGCDLDIAENKYPENLIQQTNETDSGFGLRRLQSLPTFEFRDYRGRIEVEKPLLPSEKEEEEQVVIGEDLRPKKHWKKLGQYFELIKKLDDRVREISDLKDVSIDNYSKLKRESRARVLISQVSTSILESTRTEIASNLEKMKKTEMCLKNVGSETNIHDVFEVPYDGDHRLGDVNRLEDHRFGDVDRLVDNRLGDVDRLGGVNRLGDVDRLGDHRFGDVDRLGKPDVVVEGDEIEESFGMDLVTENNEKGRLFKPVRGKGKIGNARILRSRTSMSEYQAELLLLNERMEKIEMNSVVVGPNVGDDENLILLREIREQVNVIHSEMTSLEKKKTFCCDEATLVSIQEAMLHFWL